MEIKKVDIHEMEDVLFMMDNKAFCRVFDLRARSKEEEVSYLEGSETFIGYEGGKPVGYIAFKKMEHGGIEVRTLGVLPEFQGKGYGGLLMRHLIDTTKGQEVHLVTHPKNTPAIRLYLNYGFVIVGWKDNYYGDGQPRLLLLKIA